MFMDNYIPIFIGNPVCSWITIYLSSLEILYVHGNNYVPGLSLDKLLLVMARLRYRVAPVSSSTTLVRLASCFTPPASLTEQHINQVNINIIAAY